MLNDYKISAKSVEDALRKNDDNLQSLHELMENLAGLALLLEKDMDESYRELVCAIGQEMIDGAINLIDSYLDYYYINDIQKDDFFDKLTKWRNRFNGYTVFKLSIHRRNAN